MKNLNAIVLIFLMSALTVSCSKKEAEQPSVVVPPVVPPPPPTSNGGTQLKVFLNFNQAEPSAELDSWVVYTSSS